MPVGSALTIKRLHAYLNGDEVSQCHEPPIDVSCSSGISLMRWATVGLDSNGCVETRRI
jgi:hypothetical protein